MVDVEAEQVWFTSPLLGLATGPESVAPLVAVRIDRAHELLEGGVALLVRIVGRVLREELPLSSA